MITKTYQGLCHLHMSNLSKGSSKRGREMKRILASVWSKKAKLGRGTLAAAEVDDEMSRMRR
jgi:hypothetical protein